MSWLFERDREVSSGWSDRPVLLWVEDDAGLHDRERVGQAFERITERVLDREKVLAIDDRGTWTARLYDLGWVAVSSCDGSAIGIVVRETSFKLGLAPDAIDRLYALTQSQMLELNGLREQIEQLRNRPASGGPDGGSSWAK